MPDMPKEPVGNSVECYAQYYPINRSAHQTLPKKSRNTVQNQPGWFLIIPQKISQREKPIASTCHDGKKSMQFRNPDCSGLRVTACKKYG